MKKYLLLLIAFISVSLSALAVDVPRAVMEAFTKKFPAATEVKWGKENSKEYEAEFKLNGNQVSANFLPDGSWVETESAIHISDLPGAVAAAVKSKYPNAVMVRAFKIEKATGAVAYETEFKTGNKKKELILNADGTLAK